MEEEEELQLGDVENMVINTEIIAGDIPLPGTKFY
jgi:hypothetical protein